MGLLPRAARLHGGHDGAHRIPGGTLRARLPRADSRAPYNDARRPGAAQRQPGGRRYHRRRAGSPAARAAPHPPALSHAARWGVPVLLVHPTRRSRPRHVRVSRGARGSARAEPRLDASSRARLPAASPKPPTRTPNMVWAVWPWRSACATATVNSADFKRWRKRPMPLSLPTTEHLHQLWAVPWTATADQGSAHNLCRPVDSTKLSYCAATAYWICSVADSLPCKAVICSSQLPGRVAAATNIGMVPVASGAGRSVVCSANTWPPVLKAT